MASFSHGVHFAGHRVFVIPRHEIVPCESCESDELLQRHRWCLVDEQHMRHDRVKLRGAVMRQNFQLSGMDVIGGG